MKKIVIVVAAMLLVSSFAFAEDSPDRSHVRLVSLPQQCLDAGTAIRNNIKYTCTKVDTSEVWNEIELRKFDKDIFEAYQQPLPRDPEPQTRIGLVVRQDTVLTATVMQPQVTTTEKKEVALVERRDGYKYRYARR